MEKNYKLFLRIIPRFLKCADERYYFEPLIAQLIKFIEAYQVFENSEVNANE